MANNITETLKQTVTNLGGNSTGVTTFEVCKEISEAAKGLTPKEYPITYDQSKKILTIAGEASASTRGSAVSIGAQLGNAQQDASESVGIGAALTNSQDTVVIGNNTKIYNNCTGSVAIGANSFIQNGNYNSVAIGMGANVRLGAEGAICVGQAGANLGATNAVVIGNSNSTSKASGIVIGNGLSGSGKIEIGSYPGTPISDNPTFIIGAGTSSTAKEQFEIESNGTILIPAGNGNGDNVSVNLQKQILPDYSSLGDGTYKLVCTVLNGVPTLSWATL